MGMKKPVESRKAAWYVCPRGNILTCAGFVQDNPVIKFWLDSHHFVPQHVLVYHSGADRQYGVEYGNIMGSQLMDFVYNCEKARDFFHRNTLAHERAREREEDFIPANAMRSKYVKALLPWGCKDYADFDPRFIYTIGTISGWLDWWRANRIKADEWYTVMRLVKLYKTDDESMLEKPYKTLTYEDCLLKTIYGE
jgi:hypothetical protein